MPHVLVVDDEPQLLRTMELTLVARGYDVTTASSGTAALRKVTSARPDLLILDLGLPDIDGQDLIRILHPQEPMLPIIVLSARSGSQDKVTALDLGAVDYVTKPFNMSELLARVRAAERRTNLGASATVVTLGAVHIDVLKRTAQRADGTRQPLHLTPTEWSVLEVLLCHPGQLITPRALLAALNRDPRHTDSSYLRTYVAQLRSKLEPTPNRPRYLITEPGMGYRYQP